ncbi:hypothetical protein SAMN00017477_1286 [Peptoniphilus asaccharolyticus DSM 20463]|uniref:Uncharacterized protein n=1 Tax=Peptoniphilus asaccharolyticus DSM 20463 TaxID=573058 RepID=A0A1W1V3J0_PEPAS|nr:DUF6442 family protein [Peptoniphilus asaccharolyticus]MBL7576232.1 hypothetical protein [Peptoniphilus asaccharolyticus]SMB87892.1 hypothetical protein SAMN00017477_1286 [Peptoniphilus asaccharolyticus DSM 20463]
MNKDELLEKYKKENIFNDERQKNLISKSFEMGSIFVSVAFIVVWIIGKYKKLDISQATFIFVAMLVGIYTSKLYNRDYENNIEKIASISIIVGGTIIGFANLVEWLR